MRHFVLLFSEREGSSAMADSLGRHPRIAVPFFEDLDHYIVRRNVPEERWPALPEVIGHVLRTGRYRPDFFTGAEPEEAPTDRHVVFKWRPWGEAARIGPVLAQHGAGAYLVMRRDMLNWCLSLYFTNHVAKELTDIEIDRHPQFQVASMAPEEREAFLQRLRSQMFVVEPDRLAELMRDALRIKRDQVAFLATLKQAGVPVQTVFYEDYLADNLGFLGRMIAPLGLEVADPMRHCKFEKVSRQDMMQQVTNAEAVAASPAIQGILDEWLALCGCGVALMEPPASESHSATPAVGPTPPAT